MRRNAGGSMSRLIAALSLAVLAVAIGAAQTMGTPEKFTAFAVNMGNLNGRTSAGTVEISVERWSTDAERTTLLDTLVEKGPEKLLDALQSTKRVGYIKTPESIGYDLHYAHKTP